MPKSKPSYQHHNGSGQAKVRIDNKDIYLGPFGSPESRECFDERGTEQLSRGGDTHECRLTFDELCMLSLDHRRQHYREAGEVTSESGAVTSGRREQLSHSVSTT
jgi:hypothetical protein